MTTMSVYIPKGTVASVYAMLNITPIYGECAGKVRAEQVVKARDRAATILNKLDKVIDSKLNSSSSSNT